MSFYPASVGEIGDFCTSVVSGSSTFTGERVCVELCDVRKGLSTGIFRIIDLMCRERMEREGVGDDGSGGGHDFCALRPERSGGGGGSFCSEK